MTIYLIRHSDPQYGIDAAGRPLVYGPEAGITAEGQVRAEALAHYILEREHRGFDQLVISPLTRTQQTAACFPMRNLLIEDSRLRDTDNTWAGLPVEEFMKVYKTGRIFDHPRILETIDQIADRMVAVFADYAAGDGLIGFISHGDTLRALYYRLHHPASPFPSYPELIRLIDFGPAEALRLEWSPTGGVLSEEYIYNPLRKDEAHA
ncbi:MAG TPA: histidine phosphatase family protein, partial [Aggregatilineaceae bacterium]|nr:histidine phosphatase family protein [Aggregatilineaceae bacterium]